MKHTKVCSQCERSFESTHSYAKYCSGACRNRVYRQSPREQKVRRESRLQALYGIDSAEYERMFTAQNGVCLFCGKGPGKKRLAVDHCHTTGRVRGLLCMTCNTALGKVETAIGGMDAVMRYVQGGS